MSRRGKHSPEEKVLAVKAHLEGKESINSIAERLNVHWTTVKQWIHNYSAMGTDGMNAVQNKCYSKELKEQAVLAYLAGEGSYRELAEKYKLRSKEQLRQWVKVYTEHGMLKASGTGGHQSMKDGRKTTFEERI